MSVKELIFSYQSRGADEAQRKDEAVRESVKETGKTAEEQSGKVDRWMQRNKTAIRGAAAATLGAATAIISSSSRMRAELSGVRSAFGLFADTIVGDVLPSTGSLSGAALEAVLAYRNLESETRSVISALAVGLVAAAGLVVAGIALIPAAIIGVVAAITLWFNKIGALQDGIDGTISLMKAFAALLRGDTPAALRHGENALDSFLSQAKTVMNNIPGLGEDAIADFLAGIERKAKQLPAKGRSLVDRFTGAISDRADRARDAAGDIGDGIEGRITDIVNTSRQRGRDFVDEFTGGIEDRIGHIERTAEDVAQTIRDYMPSSPAERGPLSDLDKVGPGMASTVADGLEANTGRVARGASSLAGSMATGGAGGGGGAVTVVFEAGAVVVQGTGRSREDGQNVADEVSSELERTLGSRGV